MTPIITGSPILVSGGAVFASIIVNYPEGATLTIAPNVVRQDNPSSTQRIYYVKEDGTYVITATATGGAETSQSVLITTSGQTATVSLMFPIYIVKQGIRQFVYGDSTTRYPFLGTGTSYAGGNTGITPTVKDPLDSQYSGQAYIDVGTTNRTGGAGASRYFSASGTSSSPTYYSIKPEISAFPSDSVYIHFRIMKKGGTSLRGMGIGTYANGSLLDSQTYGDQSSSDSAPVHVPIKLTSSSTSATTVSIAVLYGVRNNNSNPIGVDIYDIWFSNVADDITE